MAFRIAAEGPLNNKVNHPECGRENCLLRQIDHSGIEECLMDSVRSQWSDPSAVSYCEDPSCKKFIDLLHSRSEFMDKP